MKLVANSLALGTLLLLSHASLAYEQGSKILRFGSATVSPDTSSSALALGDTELPGTGVDVDSGSALGITGVYMLSNHWGIELVAASPFKHDVEVTGLTDDPVNLGETKHLPPTITLQWYPMDANAPIQPYVGLGINYTVFFDEKISSGANDFFVDELNATDSAELSIDPSFGVAAEAGIDFTFGAQQQWMFNLAVWWIDIDTTAEVDIPGVGTVTTDIELDPLAYMAGIGYRF